MAAVTKNVQVPKHLGNTGYIMSYPVEASAEIYIGTFVGWDTSEDAAEPCAAGAASGDFVGIALERKTGGSTDGAVWVECLCNAVIQKTLASVAATNIGDLVYADNNNDLTTASSNNTLCGRIVGVLANESNQCLVKLKEIFHPIQDTTS